MNKLNKTIAGTVVAGAIVLGATAALPDKIPENLKLKVPKSDILRSQMVNGNIEYSYKGQLFNRPVDNKEILKKRTQFVVTRDEGNGKYSAESGYNFVKEPEGWYKVETATTTPEVFNKITLFDWFTRKAFAATSGPLSPGTVVGNEPFCGNAWSNATNATVSDNAYTTIVLGRDTCSDYLKATNFGFSIPIGSTINGIVVGVEEKSSVSSSIQTSSVMMVKNGTITGEEKTGIEWPTSEAYESKGNSTDLWTLTWTVSDINASNFGFVIAVYATGDATASVDHMRITVYYTEAASTSAPNSPSMFFSE